MTPARDEPMVRLFSGVSASESVVCSWGRPVAGDPLHRAERTSQRLIHAAMIGTPRGRNWFYRWFQRGQSTDHCVTRDARLGDGETTEYNTATLHP